MTLKGEFYNGTYLGGPRDGEPHKAPNATDTVKFEELNNRHIALTWVSGKWIPTQGKWYDNDITCTDQD